MSTELDKYLVKLGCDEKDWPEFKEVAVRAFMDYPFYRITNYEKSK